MDFVPFLDGETRKEVVERKVEIFDFEHRAGLVWSCELPCIVEVRNELGSGEIWS
jgi:hypothetical protein